MKWAQSNFSTSSPHNGLKASDENVVVATKHKKLVVKKGIGN